MKTCVQAKIVGRVQGVGFRPFVYRLALDLGLTGRVSNSPQGVFIEAEGAKDALDAFLLRLEREKPPLSSIHSLESVFLDAKGFSKFEILPSGTAGEKTALVLPDIATCPDCLREICDPADRRYRYPFTNCTHCGPRFSIILSLPYDRPNTTMRGFSMCGRCSAEYENPLDRRFHAQPIACPDCGPQLELWDRFGSVLARRDDALMEAADAVRCGKTVALKGLGGFHLIADARNENAIQRLRQHKHREEKPFAVMYPSLRAAEEHCEVSELERRLLRSPESPIVLLRRKHSEIAPSVAPGNPYLGVMLPYTPLHHLLMADLDFPVVATSGNLSDEPICTDERDALDRLGGVADVFLIHNRPIARHVDDSVVRVLMGRELVLRRARGYAPLPITRHSPLTTHHSPVLAVGAHLKNAVALSVGSNIFVSQHIGDLETSESHTAFRRVISDFEQMYETHPTTIACDLHPDYLSTAFAVGAQRDRDVPVVRVQHHVAHVVSCMAENELTGPVLGVSWDGTGYGTDGTIWGGEFLRVEEARWKRVAHLRTFPLPGGDAAVKEPRRTALGALYELFGGKALTMCELAPVAAFSTAELHTLKRMLERKINCPRTSSVGRLFDVVSALAGLRQRMRFEGQAAMELEFAAEGCDTNARYDYAMRPVESEDSALVLDWEPMVHEILSDVRDKTVLGVIAAKFHNALIDMIISVAQCVREERVVLSGGCFQNRRLAELAVRRLTEKGFQAYWHQRVPPNDGGIALGQAVFASYAQEKR